MRCPTLANQDRSKKRKLSWSGRGAAAAGAGGAEVVAFAPGVDRRRTLACGGRLGQAPRLPPFPAPPSHASASPGCCRGVVPGRCRGAAPTGPAPRLPRPARSASLRPTGVAGSSAQIPAEAANAGGPADIACAHAKIKKAPVRDAAARKDERAVPLSGFFLMGMGG